MNGKIEYYRDLILELIKKDIKIRYKNSYLGYFWSLTNPLMFALIFYFVFKIVTKVPMNNYSLFLISGLFVWQWISNSIVGGVNLYIDNASLIKKVNFPRNFLAIALTFSEGFHFLVSIPIILIFMIYYSIYPSLICIFCISILFILTSVIIYSFTLLVATINLFFRDMERLIGLLMTFLFYLTPIIYPFNMVPDKYKGLSLLNPFTSLILNWQNVFLHNKINLLYLLISIGYAISLFFISTAVYNKLKYKFAELV